MALFQLQQARAALEGTRGSATTATRIIYPKTIEHGQDVGTILPTEMRASYEPYFRAYAGLERNTIHMTGDLTYTDAIWVFNLGVDAEATGSVTDTSAYTWTFLPTHTSDALKSATVEWSWADLLATVGWKVPGCVLNKLVVTMTKTIGGDATGITWDGEFMTASAATQITAHTGSLSDRTLVNALGNQVQTYINGTGSAFGTTADTRVNQLTFEVDNGYSYRDGFDGTSTAIEILRTKPRMSKVTFQRYFSDKTELDAYIAKTTRRFRAKAAGGLVGAVSAVNTIQLDYAGTPAVRSVSNVDGMVYANFELEPIDDTSISSDFKWTVINTSASIT